MPVKVKKSAAKRKIKVKRPDAIPRMYPRPDTRVAKFYKSAEPNDTRKFSCALADPFCEAAFGARVPDEYHFPTEVLTLRQRIVWSPPVGAGTTGESFTILPHPIIGAVQWTTANVALSAVQAPSGAGATIVVNNGVNKNYVNSISPAGVNFRAVSQGYRVVGWGVRLRNITQATNVGGDVVVSVLPTTGQAPASFLNLWGVTVASPQNGAWTEWARYLTLPTSTFAVGGTNGGTGSPLTLNMEVLPSSETYSAAELAQTGGIVIRPKVHSPGAAYRFRPCNIDVATNTTGGLGAVSLAAAQGGAQTSVATVDPNTLDTAGHNAVHITAIGSTTAQTYEIEVIYHVESIPIINTGLSNNYTLPSSAAPSPVGAPGTVDRIVNGVMRAPWFEFVKREGRGMLESIQQALPGLMTRAAMLALA